MSVAEATHPDVPSQFRDAALDGRTGTPAPTSAVRKTDMAAFVRQVDGVETLTLSVTGAKCGGCLSKIERTVLAIPGVQAARMNLSTGRLHVSWNGTGLANTIADAVVGLGYTVAPYTENGAAKAARTEENRLLRSMGVAAFGLANIMLLSVSVWGGHGEMGETTRTALHAISGLIALPILVFSGRHFFQSAWSVLKHGRANMDVPISLALALAYAVSVWETAAGGHHAYFDACVMLLVFLLIGRFLDARLRRQAHAAAHDLAALRNRSVNLVSARGDLMSVRAEEVTTGDVILLAAGDQSVIDLKLTDGTSSVDESLVTGESLPRMVQASDVIYAGTVNLDHPIRGEALGPASDSLLSDIADMLEAGEQKRARYRRIADQAVTLYVPFVHTAAAVTLLAWLFLGATARDAIMVAVSTLIITCPCALALAAPVAQVVASGHLFRRGIFLRSGDALERFAEIDHVILDKTGTLTLGTPKLVSTDASKADMAIAAQLARGSRHPLSRALAAAAGPGPLARAIREVPGQGVEGQVDGVRYRLGSAQWTGVDERAANGEAALWLSSPDSSSVDGGALAGSVSGSRAAALRADTLADTLAPIRAPVRFRFEDQLQADAAAVTGTLQDGGLDVEILSGDRETAVSAVAGQLGLAAWQAGVSPQGKVDRLKSLQAEGKHVLMVGDGLNDAGALSLAHASLTPGGAIDVSQSASDAVYAGGLGAVLTVLETSKRTRAVMLQNFGLAAAYNLIAVPIAVTGHVTPLIAAIAMSLSSLLVTLNALRINTTSRP